MKNSPVITGKISEDHNGSSSTKADKATAAGVTNTNRPTPMTKEMIPDKALNSRITIHHKKALSSRIAIPQPARFRNSVKGKVIVVNHNQRLLTQT